MSNTDTRYNPKHLSYSAIDSYLRCGKAFELERVVKVPRGSAWYFVGGSAVHEVTEGLDLSFFAGKLTLAEVISTPDRVKRDFETRLDALVKAEEEATGSDEADWDVAGKTKALPEGKNRSWWLEHGPEMVLRWLVWRRDSGYQMWDHDGVPGIELPLNVPLSIDPTLKAFPDRVMVTPSGELVVVDLKTGVRDPKSYLQLGVYAVAMEKAGLPRPTYGTYWMALKGQHTFPKILDHFTEGVIDTMFQQFFEGTQRGQFLPRISDECGYMCRMADACHVMGGSKAHLYDPLSPNYVGEK